MMGVIRQAGSAANQLSRSSVINHMSNGRSGIPGIRTPGSNMRKMILNWMDAPDDVYFVATDATRSVHFVFAFVLVLMHQSPDGVPLVSKSRSFP